MSCVGKNHERKRGEIMQHRIVKEGRFRSLVRSTVKPLAGLWGIAALASVCGAAVADEPPGNLIGMYIHQHWPYKYPYAVRTWQV